MPDFRKYFNDHNSRLHSNGISLRLRLLLFLIVLVLTMVAGAIIILLVTGTFSAGINESKHLLQQELADTANDVSTQFGQISVRSVEFSEIMSMQIEQNLENQKISFSDLSNHPDRINQLMNDVFDEAFLTLQKSGASGAFLILNTTINKSVENASDSRAGIYIKNMEPNIISASTPTFTLLRGNSELGRQNSVALHTQWQMEFDTKDAEYYHMPIQTYLKNSSVELSKQYFWSDPFMLPDTSEEITLCVMPVISKSGEVYGVCGFEVSSMLFKLSHMPSNITYPRLFIMFSPIQNEKINTKQALFSGGYSIKDITEKDTILAIDQNTSSFYRYSDKKEADFLGFHQNIKLYPDYSPYGNRQYIAGILVPRDDIITVITEFNILLVFLLLFLVSLGIIISVLFSNHYLRPISQSIEIIRSSNEEEAPKTNILEIDGLLTYLADYKKDLIIKAEQEKNKISSLEQFADRAKSLSPAEQCVFQLYIHGKSGKEIADELYLSINTIKTHTKHIFTKLEINSREELLLYASMLQEIGFDFSKLCDKT